MEGSAPLDVRVLGSLRVRDADGCDVTPDGDLQRRLMALLVLHRGQHVGTDAAIEALWPRRRPLDPVAALQTHVFRLRRTLPAGALGSSDRGYRLEPAAVSVDADRLMSLLSDDHRDPATTARSLTAVLDDWHGGAYPELADTDDGRIEAARLDELRAKVVEARAEALVALGRPADVVGELTALAADHPLRERPHELLMAALAGVGRRVDALRVYDDFRRRLGDELGIAPSPVLASRHAELLDDGPARSLVHRLPQPVTSLIGRDQLLADAAAMTDHHRLVTLIGTGGVGKTRLLVELGHRLRTRCADRPIVLAELATANVETVVDAVASALDIDRRPGSRTDERITAVVGEGDLVLLLDNCEHVLEPVASLVDLLLARCPRVVVVTTTRERLRIGGEQLCPVPPLPLLDGGGPADELFVERARAVRPDFTVTAAERPRIREIVRRLDGLPLAIELAAARLHTMDVADVADGLDRRFRLLAAGARTSSRHRSLGAAVEWSFDLLAVELQQLLMDVSSFVGPFEVSAAAAIADVDVVAAADGLDALTERSLLIRLPGGRFTLLETLRAFGSERLRDSGRERATRRRHAAHFVEWLRITDEGLVNPGSTGIFAIDAALPDLAEAFEWLLDHDDVGAAGQLVLGFHNFGYLRLRPDVLAWSERVLERADPDAADAAQLLELASTSAWLLGDIEGMRWRLEQASDVCRRRGDPLPVEVLQGLGDHALFEGRLDEALACFARASARSIGRPADWILAEGTTILARTYSGDPVAAAAGQALVGAVGDVATPYAAFAWYCAGEAALASDQELARRLLGRANEIAEATGASFVAGIAGTSLASIEARSGDPHAAAAQYRSLLDHWRRAGIWSTQWTMLRAVAQLLFRLGRHDDAAVLTAAVTSTTAGHRVFGDDAEALEALGRELRDVLGDARFESAAARGSVLDGEAAVEHARESLGRMQSEQVTSEARRRRRRA